MTEQAEALTFLEALDRLVGRLAADEAPDNRYIVDVLDLVEGERERVRGASEPPWPDTLWSDYRIALVMVQRHLMAVFDSYPEPPSAEVINRAIEVSRWLVMLAGDIRAAIASGRLH